MYYIGIDVGGMSIKAGIVDETGKLYIKDSVPTLPERHYSEIVADMAALCKKIAADLGIAIGEIVGVGMGIPGTINSKAGVITYSNNINFEKVPVVKEFQKYINCPVYINNDANVAALGEAKFGSGKGSRDVVFVTLGTGVGTGIITEGILLEGKMGAGAEGGHIALKMGGELCSCGKRGCWEAYASASGIASRQLDERGSGKGRQSQRQNGIQRRETRRQRRKKSRRQLYQICRRRHYQYGKPVPPGLRFDRRRHLQRRRLADAKDPKARQPLQLRRTQKSQSLRQKSRAG